MPARSLLINEESVGDIIGKMHQLGNWVVNYDELLHRKLLEAKGIRIIRHKQDKVQGQNLIISSMAKDGILRSSLRRLVRGLLPDIGPDDLRDLVDDLIREANSISGAVVLRAMRRSDNAKELIGLVLSKYLVKAALGMDRLCGWFFLDDYASFLGEDTEQIADILCLAPMHENGKPVLDVVVTEAKFIDASSAREKAKESAAQLSQTLSRIERGLGEDGGLLDAPIWQDRISDMIVDGLEIPATGGFDPKAWQSLVREGQCRIRISGWSHVFQTGQILAASTGSRPQTEVKGTKNGRQSVFSPLQTRSLLMSFFAKQAPQGIQIEAASIVSVPSGPMDFNESSDDEGAANVSPQEAPVEPPPAPAPGGSQPDVVGASDATPVTGPAPAAAQPTAPAEASELATFLARYPEPHELDEKTDTWIRETCATAQRALLTYGTAAELQSAPVLTPNSLLLRFKGTDRLTAPAIDKKRSEFYTTYGINIVNVRPEAGAVALYIARPVREVVRAGTVWRRWNPAVTPVGNTRILIAIKEEDNSPVFLDPLKQSPHTLIAGTSGSGKSVLLQNILLGLTATNTPETTQIILIDPKHGVDFGQLRNMPHIHGGKIITSHEDSLDVIENLVVEMEARYKQFQDAGANNISSFNRTASKRMPYIWLIHDEFADWMQTDEYRDGVVSLVNRLGMKARAAGIFLIFAAQRPSVDVMPMQLRDNLDNRLILRVAQEGTSQFCLNEGGAEDLLPHGQMLARLGGTAPCLCQVPFVEFDDELPAWCLMIRGLHEPALTATNGLP